MLDILFCLWSLRLCKVSKRQANEIHSLFRSANLDVFRNQIYHTSAGWPSVYSILKEPMLWPSIFWVPYEKQRVHANLLMKNLFNMSSVFGSLRWLTSDSAGWKSCLLENKCLSIQEICLGSLWSFNAIRSKNSCNSTH